MLKMRWIVALAAVVLLLSASVAKPHGGPTMSQFNAVVSDLADAVARIVTLEQWRSNTVTPTLSDHETRIAALEGGGPPPPDPACSNGLDDDGDTLIDYPSDPGCTSASDTDEFNAPPPGGAIFYVDPDFTGTKTGEAATPWGSLDASAWSTINASLATQSVTVYFSAREAGSDTNDVSAASIDITQKTPNPTGTLTLDGRSFYNTNDATPNWTPQPGIGRAQVQAVLSQNISHIKYSNWTVDGLTVLHTGGGKGISICGDNVTVKNSDISMGGTAGGPLVLIVPSADGAHAGSSEWCPAMTNVTLQNNRIFNSRQELVYVGGAGCTDNNQPGLTSPACQGMPSHSNVTIADNAMWGCGAIPGGEGDCIDAKAAITNLTISNNNITTWGLSGVETRALVLQGIQTGGPDQNILIERNYFHDGPFTSDAAVVLANSWGTPNGVTFRNNIVDTIGGGEGFISYASQSVGVKVYSNTFYNISGLGISTAGSTMDVRNNIFVNTNGGGAPNSFSGGTATVTHNAFSGAWSGTCTSCIAASAADFVNAAGGNFQLTNQSPAREAGVTLGGFVNDFLGVTRTAPWSIGALEWQP